jgi:hypothetical protein
MAKVYGLMRVERVEQRAAEEMLVGGDGSGCYDGRQGGLFG